METNKVSFGFNKIVKKPNLLLSKKPLKEESKVELIKCLEGQEIKLLVEKPQEKEVVIPLQENQKTSAALASLIRRRAVLLGEEEPEPDPKAPSITETVTEVKNGPVENLEQRAARELLTDIKNAANALSEDQKLVLPIVKPDDLPLDGAKESSLDDYETIPVQVFGKAMLRGMGWVEPPKKKDVPVDDLATKLRPKGMGLGADKALKLKPLLIQPEKNEILEIRRQAYVRILAGKHKDLYGQIVGFDDHAGRVIVKMAIGGNMEVFNEFMCQPVSKKEFSEYGKCINTTKYDEYKRKENAFGQIIIKKEEEKLYNKVKAESKADYEKETHYDSSYKKLDIKKEKMKEEPDDSEIKTKVYENEKHRIKDKKMSSEPSCSYRQNDNRNENYENRDKKDIHKSLRHRSRSSEHIKSKSQSSSSRNRNYSPDTQTSDSSDSSESYSSSRRHRNRKSSKNKSKRKSKKSKSKYANSPYSDTSDEEHHRRKTHKKTKKSKKERARSRSRERR